MVTVIIPLQMHILFSFIYGNEQSEQWFLKCCDAEWYINEKYSALIIKMGDNSVNYFV